MYRNDDRLEELSVRKKVLLTEAAAQRDLILNDVALLRQHSAVLRSRARTFGAVALKVGLIFGAAATGRRLLSRPSVQKRPSIISPLLQMGARWAMGMVPHFFNRK